MSALEQATAALQGAGPAPVALAALLVAIAALWLLSGRREASPAKFLDGQRLRRSVPLLEKEALSHDVRRFRFGLPNENMVLGLPIGKHVKVFGPNTAGVKEGEWNGRPDPDTGKHEIERKYTPTSSDNDRGYFELVLKVYPGGVKEPFTDGGRLSQYLDSLKVGDKVDVEGPFGLYSYEGRGTFIIKRQPRKFKAVGMIAGGTGITPMLQVINTVLRDPEDHTKLHLLFANQTEEDIFLRDKLEALQREYPDQFKLHYTLDRPPADWKYSSGFVNEEMIREHLPAPADDVVVLMCGPPPMIKFACRPNLTTVGHAAENQIDF